MKILVLGGAGYIGSHFVKTAIQKKNEVFVVDNLQTGHLEALDKKAKFFKGDIRDKLFMADVFEKCSIDVCVHFAANSLVGVSMEKPNEYFDNNVYGTIVLLEMMQKFNVKKIVFSSSAAVYGTHIDMPITEEYATLPTNPYGESKLMMENMMKWADQAYGIKYVSLRYFNVAGASKDATIGEDHNPETHLIPLVLQVPLENSDSITIFGNDYDTLDGTCIRDYIHIADLVDAHLKAIDYLFHHNDSNVFNLGSEIGYSNLEIVKVARDVTKHPIPMKIGGRRMGDPAKLVASYQKAKRILDWMPKRGIGEIISSAWAFHQSHPYGYKEEK
ncbi:MAG: UDP-glucose 4-epimerase GalE [Candidatus Izemoplasmatales bacterium]|jgi:UDP-glucose 4-epimerase|nr:UDP-glucose 4-epimerase GalE [Candidatus Izemoplasmatales bacterium]